ncbi:hypothetical protein RhiirA1_444321 [Rhizophagus irregularis]|uniref:AAA+ ATPase domain-containing protein n=1 Tax=Rhizophagus irregularis TaxID=588596 RepID=A0A2N0REJ6_9GLOM|nr:hypothetical protein RhiirA1_444321 [Rhizophagus irregularis]
MEIGTRPEMDIPDSKFISRPEIAKYFEKIFQPDEDQSNYHIIYGNKGNGKTTLAKKMANEVGQGVIYVDTPYNIENFEKSFGSIHDFTFKEDSSFLFQLIQKFFDKAGVNKIDKLKRALNAFTKAAKIYKEQYDNPPVIIYDNIDNIDPKILEILQDDAEYNANNGTYIAVFICGGEKFTQILQSSRKSHIFEVEDLNKDESVNFLIQKLKISPEDADKIYGLVGGNIRELKFVAERLKNGELLEDIKENILLEVEKKFDIAKLDLTQEGRSIIGTLLKSKEVGYLEFKKVFGKVEGFNGMNIFTYHHKARSVTFQSRPIELYIKKSLSAFSLLLYKRFHDNSLLWSDRIFEPITGFLLWVVLHSSFRICYLIFVAFNLMPNAFILRSIINFSGWAFVQFAIATYIAGILLVALTQESVKLTNGRNEPYNAYLKKLKTINFALMVIVSWSSISFLSWAICSIKVKANFDLPTILSFITNNCYVIMIMAAIIGIIRGQLYPKDINDADMSLSTISNVRWSQSSIVQTNSTIET